MANLILPDEVTIQLIDTDDQPLEMANVIFFIYLFARRKNDFHLGPYVSDSSGKVTIPNEDLQHEIAATFSSGVMDYAPVKTAFPLIEIRLSHPDDIDRIINGRMTTGWTSLLNGEKERWETMENLISTYRNSSNSKLKVTKGFSKIRDEWDGSKKHYEYLFRVQKK